ncbi:MULTISPECIES: hypothetical protein [Sinorhizobium]|uniref:Uncharacterized protein n=1 Tax=Sinorhizobium mexicanum TaxID=375549 RepID=A0A859QWE8_9HYPH|nr:MULTISPECIES: hypothetical protein [Sinorhizobium]MBP1884057.1 putative transposase YbfD/YdcC [Sinorhizobium mexicanum]MDK1377371.1 hypothetical protein [Sinorhizobium sp. 6-70]MDK1478861.1 hypothetical protein [Sinorhizobium sp. 6-117]QLL64776.1 hypothetical protein FKV68_25585 [Sinorhizobium mexicanum]
MPQQPHSIATPAEHIVTAREALELLYLHLEQEAEAKLVAAAIRAGWSAEEALSAIDELKLEDMQAIARRKS